MNEAFLDCREERFAFALDKDNQLWTSRAFGTVPMWFGLLDERKRTR